MLRFSQVEVFANRLGDGNPVAVVHGADELDTETMARFARWTNLSETTFLLRPTDPAADYRLRIFTPGGELPFAGHPTLGSARAWLDAGGSPSDDAELLQECGAGLVRVRRGERLAFAAPPLLRDGPVAREDLEHVLAALRIGPDAVLDARWVDNGPGWLGLFLQDADTVLRLEPDLPGLLPFFVGVAGLHPPGSEAAVEVRAFFGAPDVREDPVTGSLNASLAQWLVADGHLPDQYLAAQGTCLGRRGRIHVHADGADVWVGGDTLVGITGTVTV